jgi:alpha-L-rhamnosidase
MTDDRMRLDEWSARWIEPVEPDGVPDLQRPAHHLATGFRVDQRVRSATLRITAHGVYEAFLNGSRIGDHELSPGFTAYRKRLQVHTFDVTALVIPGANVLGAHLSDG